MMKKAIYLFAVVTMLSACKKSDNSYHLHYEEDGCEYDYYIDDFDGLDYETVERYAAFDIADDHRSIVALMDSLIDAGTNLRSWWSRDYFAMKETLPPDSILPKLQRLLEHKPSNASIYWAIGNTYSDLDDTQKAIEYFNKGLDIASDFSYLWLSLGIVTLQHGDTVSAVNDLTKALELAKKHALEWRVELIQQMLDSIGSKYQS